jgi:hypothetical protein
MIFEKLGMFEQEYVKENVISYRQTFNIYCGLSGMAIRQRSATACYCEAGFFSLKTRSL